MFGFSLPKLIVLALIIAVIWYGFKRFSDRKAAPRVPKDHKPAAGKADEPDAVDMARCGVCGDFVPDGADHCGKTGCPYPL